MSFRKRIAADTWIAIATAVCLFATFHPLNLWPLAWVAPVGWIYLARKEKLASSFRGLYLAGFVHWILLLHWVRLPHPALVFGWLALAAYLAVYIPLFIFDPCFPNIPFVRYRPIQYRSSG